MWKNLTFTLTYGNSRQIPDIFSTNKKLSKVKTQGTKLNATERGPLILDCLGASYFGLYGSQCHPQSLSGSLSVSCRFHHLQENGQIYHCYQLLIEEAPHQNQYSHDGNPTIKKDKRWFVPREQSHCRLFLPHTASKL
jgi:hypothetical protein